MKPLSDQIGGNHYKHYDIQPIEIMYMYDTTPAVSKALKYLLRYRDKGGAKDLHKAKHCIDIALEMEYPEHDSQEQLELPLTDA